MKIKFPATVIVLILFLQCNVFAQQITKVGPVCITVKQLDASVKFYSEVLHFKYLSTEDFFGEEQEVLLGKFGIHYKVAHLQLGDEYVDLIDYLTNGGRSIPDTEKSNDLNFQHIAIVVSDMEKAFALLQKNNVEFVSTNPQTIPVSNLAAAGIKAFYFHDNDNHTLELIYFPKGKGKAKWQSTNGEIFLGIDHTAIGISNTGNSLLYWKDKLMLDKKGESHNIGTEQAHLNNIKSAELQITGLAAPNGPGVEFLQYLLPGAGNIYPADTQCDDLWNWITKVNCTGIETIYQKLLHDKTKVVSEKIVTIKGKKNFIARDPDGHAVWFIEN
jgi:catechol 2,3-dioxygenase-like lactoylglutathione lyase family enzyme